jgi:hypothetical protein
MMPRVSQDILRAVGCWLEVNGDSVHAIAVTSFSEGLGVTGSCKLGKSREPVFGFSAGEFRGAKPSICYRVKVR